MTIRSIDDMRAAGERILTLGPRVVLVKGGHLDGPESVDVACTRGRDVRAARAADRQPAHARHRLHAVVGDRRQPRARAGRSRRRSTRARDYLEGAIRHAPGSRARSRPARPFLAGYTEIGTDRLGSATWQTARFRSLIASRHGPTRRRRRSLRQHRGVGATASAARSRRSSASSAITTPGGACCGSTTRRIAPLAVKAFEQIGGGSGGAVAVGARWRSITARAGSRSAKRAS